MTMMDRSPAGRVADEGFATAVTDRSVNQLLVAVIDAVDKLRLAMTRAGVAVDLDDIDELSARLE